MAAEWDPGISYAPGASVTYRGLPYYRSQYPATATTGTPPNSEMSVDSKGTAVRTWMLFLGSYSSYAPRFASTYFRLIEPTFNSTDASAEFQYSGAQFEEGNAYSPIGDPAGTVYGITVEMDQAKTNPSPTPASPVCPADKCGVAFQNGQEQGLVQCSVDSQGDATNPRKYYIFVHFNHPLYFRRTITVITRVLMTETLGDPPVTTETYLNTYTNVTPTDNNYCSSALSGSYFVPANAAFEILVPDDTATATYAFAQRGLSDVTAND